MKRTRNLENVIYRKKYREIYEILFNADLDEVSDHSTWFKSNQDWVDKNRPLWIIAESRIINKRIWVCQDFGKLEVTTATLNLPCNSIAYSNSFKHATFKNQKEMANYLKLLLEPCLQEFHDEEEEEL